jgi:16S rRNA (guanine966-N2)-methyltransferase
VLGATESIKVVHSSAIHYLENTDRMFDLVFLDPPFNGFDVEEICRCLVKFNLLGSNALVYVESAKSKNSLPIPTNWNIIRQSSRGMVQSTLIEVCNVGK